MVSQWLMPYSLGMWKGERRGYNSPSLEPKSLTHILTFQVNTSNTPFQLPTDLNNFHPSELLILFFISISLVHFLLWSLSLSLSFTSFCHFSLFTFSPAHQYIHVLPEALLPHCQAEKYEKCQHYKNHLLTFTICQFGHYTTHSTDRINESIYKFQRVAF